MKNFLCPFVFMIITFTCFAQEKSKEIKIPKGETFKSSHSLTINGNTIQLEAETGTVQLRDENDKPIALFGFTHYKKPKSKMGSKENRPIVFAFNGGPLSASFWLHFGILGPKRV
ncbi:MAG: hypothetical protein P1U56_20910, partial [Saprospiraceae bacterium]|nr:hypothetical protein [Saprospiraceae bacterium]